MNGKILIGRLLTGVAVIIFLICAYDSSQMGRVLNGGAASLGMVGALFIAVGSIVMSIGLKEQKQAQEDATQQSSQKEIQQNDVEQ